MTGGTVPAPLVAPPAADEPTALSAGELAAAFAARRLAPSDALDACLARIAAFDPAVNAFLVVDAKGARAAAAESDRRHAAGLVKGPLDGVPVAIKDNVDVAGLPTTAGHARSRGHLAGRDAAVVSALRAAGAVLVGKTNLDEGALGARTANPHFGRTVNPLAQGHVPGGSSGGSGAAVAARFVPLAIGTDTMGSVRIPAAYCGVLGLKPTAGLVSRGGVAALSPLLDTVGPIARTAADLAEAIHAIRGFDAADEASQPAPEGWTAFGDTLQDLSGVRLGVPRNVRREALEPAVAAAFDRALAAIGTLGGSTVPVELEGWRPDMDRRAGLLVIEAEGATELEPVLSEGRQGFGEEFLALLDYGRRAPVPKLVRAFRTVRRAGTAARRALAGLDAFVLPTAPQRAFAHDAAPPDDQADLTALANFAGLPAVSLPVATDGLPAGLQLVGPPFSEGRLLALAEILARLLARPRPGG